MMDVIRVDAPTADHAQRLISSIGGTFSASLDGDGIGHVVGIMLDDEAAARLIELFDALAGWLTEGGLATCRIGFGGDRTYMLAAARDGRPNDPAPFLLERTIQLQRALHSRIVIEQAKGVLAERNQITPEEAFKRLRREARSKQMNIHVLTAGIVATTAVRPPITP
jgi:ANTAR domain-containing protein